MYFISLSRKKVLHFGHCCGIHSPSGGDDGHIQHVYILGRVGAIWVLHGHIRAHLRIYIGLRGEEAARLRIWVSAHTRPVHWSAS